MPVVRLSLDQLREHLERVESDYGMPAHEFYDRYREGLLGDSNDVIYRAGLCYMALRRGILSSVTIAR
jgi:hypothetical protein